MWGKKEGHLTDAEREQGRLGDNWDHVVLNPRTRFVPSLVCGKRTKQNTRRLFEDFRSRTDGRVPNLITSDELSQYADVILETYGLWTPQERQGDRGRFPSPVRVAPPDLVYATVHKDREKGRVVKVERRLVFGTPEQLQQALQASPVSSTVNTSFIERYNGTARHRNSRQVRKTYGFSKDGDLHEHPSFLSLFDYNFCWTPRTLEEKDADGHRRKRSPAMAQGVADHVWTAREFLRYQVVPRR